VQSTLSSDEVLGGEKHLCFWSEKKSKCYLGHQNANSLHRYSLK